MSRSFSVFYFGSLLWFFCHETTKMPTNTRRKPWMWSGWRREVSFDSVCKNTLVAARYADTYVHSIFWVLVEMSLEGNPSEADKVINTPCPHLPRALYLWWSPQHRCRVSSFSIFVHRGQYVLAQSHLCAVSVVLYQKGKLGKDGQNLLCVCCQVSLLRCLSVVKWQFHCFG